MTTIPVNTKLEKVALDEIESKLVVEARDIVPESKLKGFRASNIHLEGAEQTSSQEIQKRLASFVK